MAYSPTYGYIPPPANDFQWTSTSAQTVWTVTAGQTITNQIQVFGFVTTQDFSPEKYRVNPLNHLQEIALLGRKRVQYPKSATHPQSRIIPSRGWQNPISEWMGSFQGGELQ